jgi:hypothetical protein
METLTDVKVEPFEQNWKDWFIVDEPKQKMSLSVFLDQTRHFYVDPRFNRFKLTGIMKKPALAQYKIYYKFKDNQNKIHSTHGYTCLLEDIGSIYMLFKVFIIKGE